MSIINGIRYDFSANTKYEKHTPKQSPEEGTSVAQQQQDQSTQNSAYGNVNATDANFAGPTQNTPYYKSLVASSTDATAGAYNNAAASSKANAAQAGFGASSPIGQATSRETQGAEASALAGIPAAATAATAPLQLQAGGQQLQEGTAAGQQGLGYEQEAGNLNNAYQQRKASFTNQLIGSGLGAGASIFNSYENNN
jgi:hypothetical protein